MPKITYYHTHNVHSFLKQLYYTQSKHINISHPYFLYSYNFQNYYEYNFQLWHVHNHYTNNKTAHLFLYHFFMWLFFLLLMKNIIYHKFYNIHIQNKNIHNFHSQHAHNLNTNIYLLKLLKILLHKIRYYENNLFFNILNTKQYHFYFYYITNIIFIQNIHDRNFMKQFFNTHHIHKIKVFFIIYLYIQK